MLLELTDYETEKKLLLNTSHIVLVEQLYDDSANPLCCAITLPDEYVCNVMESLTMIKHLAKTGGWS